MEIRKLLGKELLFFDGAMGTMLQAMGLPPGELPERWNLTNASSVQTVHEAYLDSGANIIKSNTFGANRLKFQDMDITVDEVVEAAMSICKKAVQGREKKFIALDLGPTGKLLAPHGDLPFEEAVDIYAEVIQSGVKYGADLILIETMSDTYEIKAALLAAKENSKLPVVVTMSFDEDGKLLTGADVTGAVAMVEALGADAVGFNCGLGPQQMESLLPQLLFSCSLPLVLNPNAGLPVERDGKTIFNVDPSEFAQLMKNLISKGIAIAGGCCGTTPQHIKTLVDSCQGLQISLREPSNKTIISAYGKAVVIDKEPILIGERINPTGKPKLKQALFNDDFDYICRLGLEQIEKEVHVLDVNVGVPGIDEKTVATKTLLALQSITSTPLQIDTADYDTMEKALRIYNGKPLLNSVSGKEESLQRVLPLAKKYGAAIVGLALDDDGIPKTVEGRLKVAEKIINAADQLGIKKQDIIIDPLALTISTGAHNAEIDLAVIRKLKEAGVKTVMGVSNISFGLPAREAVNSAFFIMALEAGLSCAIINPQSKQLLDAYHAYKALKGFDHNCERYLQYFSESDVATESKISLEYNLHNAIVKGLREQSISAVKTLLLKDEPLEIINREIIPALDLVGSEFEKRTRFLPQLLMSAEAAKAAFGVIRDKMSQTEQLSKGETIIIATVKGDIHDIGKNIVKVLLENYGYRVVDLGKDVAVEEIVATTLKHKARIVGLSALMTTTVGAMEETIKNLRAACDCKVIVGGAVLTNEYAKRIGADHYAASAVSAVNYANSIT